MNELVASNQLFKAFADPTRLRILNLLRQEEVCVCHLMEVLALPQSRISRHLAHLKRVGLVDVREEGTWNYYRLAKPTGKLHQTLLSCVAECLSGIDQLQADRRKLERLAVPA